MRINVTTKFEHDHHHDDHDCETKSECMPACRNLVGSNIIRLVMSSTVYDGSWEGLNSRHSISKRMIHLARRHKGNSRLQSDT
jgi:hypothetical protein